LATYGSSKKTAKPLEFQLNHSKTIQLQHRTFNSITNSRFYVDESINSSTNVAIFSLFDGHGGDHAADYAKDVLVKNLCNKILQVHDLSQNKAAHQSDIHCTNDDEVDASPVTPPKDDKTKQNEVESDILDKINSKGFSMLKQMQLNLNEPLGPPPKARDAKCYVGKDKNDYGRLITDEVLMADYKLVEMSRRKMIIAGSTALIAVVDGSRLIVANVGDSRGVMCDHLGHSVPLSFDHRPQAAREHKRIQEAGGFIAFKGVWRVSGILATSRSLGDYPLKPKLVIANPDILEFELADHRPLFIVLASDGLWDTFSNEEAVAFVKSRLHEPHFGAKSLTLESYARGSVDNITVIVVVFKNGKLEFGSSK
jgi:protein phosphatase 1L